MDKDPIPVKIVCDSEHYSLHAGRGHTIKDNLCLATFEMDPRSNKAEMVAFPFPVLYRVDHCLSHQFTIEALFGKSIIIPPCDLVMHLIVVEEY